VNFGINGMANAEDQVPMSLAVHYPFREGSWAPCALNIAAIRSVAAQVRRQVGCEAGSNGLAIQPLLRATRHVVVNGRPVEVLWDLTQPIHDEAGRPVLGVCVTEPEDQRHAFVAVNASLTANRPELALSTAAHELGHVLFEVPAALQAGSVCYRAVAASPAALERTTRCAEGRANEFMGALLAPPVALHTRMLVLAREERLHLARGQHQGRPGGPILAAGNPPEAVAGIIAVLATDFGISERFIEVRLRRYGLMQGAWA
jgi:hypothetical protein